MNHLDCGHGVILELVKIPTGEFMMGSNLWSNSQPRHKVTLSSFLMGKYPVTQKQYQAVMNESPSYFTGDDNYPVESVTWDKSVEFCQKLAQRTGYQVTLPSEAQWEYAARARTTTAYSFGNSEKDLDKYAWYWANSNKTIHPVGLKLPNPWGLYDTLGNVWEWCLDDWHENYLSAPHDGSAWLKGNSDKVVRGGGWIRSSIRCLCGFRSWYSPEDRSYDVGFRVVVMC